MGQTMQDVVFVLGLGLLTFILMLGWFTSVAKAASTQVPRQAVYVAGAFCAAMTLFFLVVALLHLGHQLFGWMGR